MNTQIETDWDDARTRIKTWQMHKQTIVLTNGVFDLLHAGHVMYLSQARDLGDKLVVGINTDESVKNIKGEKRPIIPLEDRMNVLAALRTVDLVVPFAELSAEKLVSKLKPDTYVKGRDYEIDDLPEAEIVRTYGGTATLIEPTIERSTTEIIEEIQRRYCE